MLRRLHLAWLGLTKPHIMEPALNIYADLMLGAKQVNLVIKFTDGSEGTETYELVESTGKYKC